MKNKQKSFVGRRPTREADRQDVAIHSCVRFVIDGIEQRALRLLMSLPQLVGRDADRIAQGQGVASPIGKMPIVEALKRRSGPGRGMHPVRDRMDRIPGEQPAGDLSMFHGHAVDVARAPKRQLRHVQRSVVPAFREQGPEPLTQHAAGHVDRKLVVSRRHRRMSRKDTMFAHGFQGRLAGHQRLRPLPHPLFEQPEHQ